MPLNAGVLMTGGYVLQAALIGATIYGLVAARRFVKKAN